MVESRSDNHSLAQILEATRMIGEGRIMEIVEKATQPYTERMDEMNEKLDKVVTLLKDIAASLRRLRAPK